MSYFNQESYNQFVLDNDVVGFFDEAVTLKSGRKSHWYVNWRKVVGDVFRTDELADHIIGFTRLLELEPDCFYGVPEGATKTAVITQYKWAQQSPGYSSGSHVLPMGRGKPKEGHGKPEDKYYVGAPSGKVIVVEDVTTTGGSLLGKIEELDELDDVEIIAALGLTNRCETTDEGLSVADAVKEAGVNYFSLTDAFQILPEAYVLQQPGKEIARHIEDEFAEYGVKEINLI